MGIREDVLSPTFNLVLGYQLGDSATRRLEHIDAWKMQSSEELETLGFTKMLLNKNSVISIEWADRVGNIIRKHSEDAVIIWIKIEYGKKENERLISWGVSQ